MVLWRRTWRVLPHGISKASGLREAMWRLRVSLHNGVAIGDGENDQPLLDACEIGIAVASGCDALKRNADVVIQGRGPAAVAGYIRHLLAMRGIPPDQIRRRWVRLGTRDSGEPLDMAVRGRNVVIAGDPKSGKSWIAGLLCEQLILMRYSVYILDPEGDYKGLDALPGVIVHRLTADNASF
ncbi:MAG: HAD hydrolase family protein, partial [Bauldia sp.]